MSDKMFTCPYNPAHVMRHTRAHHHVVNCRKANIHKNFVICSYNALHHYPPEQEAKHQATCADRIAMIDSSYVTYDMNKIKGNLSMPPPPNIKFDDEETWSD